MAADRVSKIIAAFEAGALTVDSACLEIFLAAGEGGADAIFASLTPGLQSAIKVAATYPMRIRILESHCGTSTANQSDLQVREELANRGMMALHRVTRGNTGGG